MLKRSDTSQGLRAARERLLSQKARGAGRRASLLLITTTKRRDDMNRFLSHLSRALPFITFPLCAFAAWLSTILGLLIWWTATKDARRLRPDDATILYISDTGTSLRESDARGQLS